MADAHVRLGNRLLEAIISAGFHGTQYKIVLAVARQTIGWQGYSVTSSRSELATLCGCSPVGGFRRALKELIDEGVIVLVAPGGGASSNGYALNQNFEQWGRFSQADAKLAALWGRPESDDQLSIPALTLTLQGPGAGPSGVQVLDPPGSRSPDSTDGTAASSTVGKTFTDIEKLLPKLDRADAQELLTQIEALREKTGGQSAKWIIRRDRIREQLGADVDEGLRMIGGVDVVLRQDPRYRGVLVGDLQRAVNRVRGHDRKAATA